MFELGLLFTVYSWSTAYVLQMGTALLTFVFFGYIVYKTHHSSPYRSVPQILTAYAQSTSAVFLSAIFALVAPIFVALFLMSNPIGRHMAWFAREWYGAVIFSPMSLLGMYGAQYLLTYIFPSGHVDREYGSFVSVVLAFGISTLLTTLTSVASSYIFWIYSSILLFAMAVNEFVLSPSSTGKSNASKPKIHSITYAISCIPLALLYTDYTYAMIDIFVPLTGRMGVDTPVDIIIGIVFGMVNYMTVLPSLAHIHRFGKQCLRKILIGLALFQVAILAIVMIQGGSYGGWAFPYDEYHPKRL